jgi:hypothetical protein
VTARPNPLPLAEPEDMARLPLTDGAGIARLVERLRRRVERAVAGKELRKLRGRLQRRTAALAAEKAGREALAAANRALSGQYSELKALYAVAKPNIYRARWMGKAIADVSVMHERHSLTPGRSDWAEKWRTTRGRRILYFAPCDYSGSLYKWAEAVNRHTPHAVRLVALYRHIYGYPLDLLYMRGDVMVADVPQMFNSLCELADEADIVHIKDEQGFRDGRNRLPLWTFKQFRKPIVYTFYGGKARHKQTEPEYQRYVLSNDVIIAMTPDLCFDWSDSVFIPHAIDVDGHPYRWRDGGLILHTPSNPARKGTDLFRAAAERIRNEFGARAEIISNASHQFVMREKPRATLFFDQAGRESEAQGSRHIGWYGNSALEAAVFGVPTMAYMAPEAIEQARRAGFDDVDACPFLNATPSEEGLYRIMRDFFAKEEDARRDLSVRTRKWIEDRHSYQTTARQLDRVYAAL